MILLSNLAPIGHSTKFQAIPQLKSPLTDKGIQQSDSTEKIDNIDPQDNAFQILKTSLLSNTLKEFESPWSKSWI